MSIKSPYNFVPLSNRVFFPDWADQVSQDIPFSDGISGEMIVAFKACSPIFVRNGQKNSEPDVRFSNIDNTYFIPGTSIKGMVRSVLEILSFAKFEQVDDRKYSWRKLQNQDYSSRFTESPKAEPLVRAGFIEQCGNDWYLIPAKFARIEQCELGNEFGVADDQISARDKYLYWEKQGKKIVNNFTISDSSTNEFKKQCGKFRRAKIDKAGKVVGSLVFTGQINPRVKGEEGLHGKGNKHLEFVFFEKEEEKRIKVDEKMIRDFKLNHTKERNVDNHKLALAPNEEWAHWKKQLEAGKQMPVFWLKKGENSVEAFGLSMLFRLPFKNSIKDLIPADHKLDKYDLSEIMFGTAKKNKELKGRVHFSIAKTKGIIAEQEEKFVVLSSPKASFYPAYIRQKNGKYITYDNQNAELAGRKRYPIHKSNEPVNNYKPGMNNLKSNIKAINKGTLFQFKIRYHNLKPIELGALFSALTFHGNTDLYHSIGLGKPLGYGKIKIKYIQCEQSVQNILGYLKAFENEMNKALGENQEGKQWHLSEQINEFFAIAKESSDDDKLRYLSLAEFREIEKQNAYLERYSKIAGKYYVRSLLDSTHSHEEFARLFKRPDVVPTLPSEEEKIAKMSISQFKKYLKQQAKNKKYNKVLCNAYKRFGEEKTNYIKMQLNKENSIICDYLNYIQDKYNFTFY